MATLWTVDTRELDALCRAFSAETRSRLHLAGARSVAVLCRRHLRALGQSRHASANRLGAAPSGHFEQAIVEADASADDAHVRLLLPGLSRAFRSLTLVPRRARALTIPLAAEAYGKKASELSREGWALFATKGVLMGSRKSTGATKPLYALKSRVRLRQDRSLLPSDNALSRAAREGFMLRLVALIKGTP